MEIQETLNSQNNLGKKKKEESKREESHSLTSDYTTRLQSSRQNGNDIKADTQISGTGQKAQK